MIKENLKVSRQFESTERTLKKVSRKYVLYATIITTVKNVLFYKAQYQSTSSTHPINNDVSDNEDDSQ